MIAIQKLSLGDISVSLAKVILHTLEQYGFAVSDIQKRFNLNDEFLDNPNTRISIPKYMHLGHHAARLTSNPAIGLEFGKNTLDSSVGLAGFAASCAPTLGQALGLSIDMERLNSHNSRGQSSHFIDEGRLHCQFYSISPYNQFNHFVVDTMLATWWSFIKRHCTSASCHHIEIEYPRPKYANVFEEFFECPVLFNQGRNALILKRGHEQHPLAQSHQGTFTKLKSLCEEEALRWQTGSTIADQVIDLISANLSGTPPEIETIARMLGMSGWTLRRRLAKEGKHFQTLLDNTRNALAQTYVRDTEHNFTEIAFLLGFSSPSAFQRAFKRWTQLSPGAFRNKLEKKIEN